MTFHEFQSFHKKKKNIMKTIFVLTNSTEKKENEKEENVCYLQF